MAQVLRENTLFLGNGFSRSVFHDVPSWGELFEGVTTSVQNYASAARIKIVQVKMREFPISNR